MTDLVKTDSCHSADAPADVTSTYVAVQPAATPPVPLNRGSPKPEPLQDFVEVDGTTTFAPPPAPTYRYKLSLKTGKLRIWLEDCKTKQQWCTSDLTIDSYANISNALPGTEASDYLECFRAVLDAVVEDGEDSSDNLRTFQRTTDGDAFRLRLSLEVDILTRTTLATYSFNLEPIAVEQVDVLGSRMRDLENDMRVLRSEPGQLSALAGLQKSVKKLQQEFSNREDVIVEL